MNYVPDEPGTPAATDRGQVPPPRRARQETPQPHHASERRRRGHRTHGQRLPSTASLALITALCTAGLLYLALQFTGLVRVFFPEAALAVFLGLATLVFGFWALRRIRPVRAPGLAASLAAVAWGLTAAIGTGLIANSGLSSIWAKSLGLGFSGLWGPAMTAPLNEETLKLAGIVLVAVAFPYTVRGPLDGFVIGSLVGLGFEVTENFVYAMNAVVQSGGTGGLVPVIQTSILRVGLTGLGSHWAMSAIAGTAVGLLAAVAWRPGVRRAVGAVLLVVLAIALHWLVDSPLLSEILGIMLKVAVVFVTTMAVYFTVRFSYRRRVRQALASEGEAMGMRRSAAVALASRRGRSGELRHVALPERPAVERRQQQMLETAEDRAARHPA